MVIQIVAIEEEVIRLLIERPEQEYEPEAGQMYRKRWLEGLQDLFGANCVFGWPKTHRIEQS